MPQYVEVEGEVIEFPDGMSSEEISGALSGIGKAGSALAGAAQGATFGLGDEAAGGIQALVGKIPGGKSLMNRLMGLDSQYEPVELTASAQSQADEAGLETPDSIYSYTAQRDRARGVNEQAQSANPGSYLAGELSTGLAAGVPGGLRAAAGQTFRQAVPRLAAVGGAEGSLAGFGHSDADTAAGVAGDTVKGGFTGAVLGTAIPGAVAGSARAAKNLLGSSQRAQRTFANDLAESGIPADQLNEALSNPNMIAADLSENLQQRLGAVANAPGATPQAARELLRARNAGQKDRFGAQFRSALGDTPVAEAAERAVQRTREKAGPLYERAYEVVIPPAAQKRLKTLLKRDPGAMKSAQDLLRRRGEDIDLEGPMDVRTVDKITSYLGGRARTLRSGASPDAQEAASFEVLRGDILDVIDPIADTLPKARAIAADEFANRDALKLGSKVFREKTPNLRSLVKDMSESEREHFKVGVFEEVMDIIASRRDNVDLVKLFDTDKRKAALRMAFGSEPAYKRFISSLGDESTMFETMSKAITGSPTASRIAFGKEINVEPTLNPFALAGRGATKAVNAAMKGPNTRANDELGRLLMSRNPSQVLKQLSAPQPLGQATAALAAPAALDPDRTLQGLLGQ